MGVLLALSSALVYGAADFCGGLAARRAPAPAVVAAAQATGLVLLLVVLPVLGGPLRPADVAWGAAAGVAGGAALLLFYRALAAGVMSVVAPVAAVCATAVPVLAGLVLGERPGAAAVAGILLALAAVVLVAAEDGLRALRRARSAGLGAALAAGLGFGAFFALLDRTSASSGLSPLAVARTTAVVLALAAARGRIPLSRAARAPALLAGVLDVVSNALFLLAAREPGQLAVVGVLASLYPVSTVVLAQAVLRERLGRTQAAGLGVAAAAVVLLALPT